MAIRIWKHLNLCQEKKITSTLWINFSSSSTNLDVNVKKKEIKDELKLLIYIFSGALTPKISKAFLIVVLALSTRISLVSSTSEPMTCCDL